MRLKLVMVVSLLVFTLMISSPQIGQTVQAADVSDIKILMLVTDSFGWNYFDAKDRFESWGINVTTVAYSSDYNISSCPNREPRPITADLLISEMTPEMVSQFECLYIPSGAHWLMLIGSNTVLTFISDAYELGLVVASVCIGTRVIAEANNIVNGSKVVFYTGSWEQMMEADATLTYGVTVVTDAGIVTGSSGGGPTGGGYLEAPTSEVCAEIVRHALRLSRVNETSLYPSRGPIGTSFSIGAVIDNLNDTLGDILSTDVQEVTAQIYGYGNRTLIDTIELTDDNLDGNYTGTFTGRENGDFVVDIEVEDSNSTLEVVRAAEIFEVGLEPTRPIDVVMVSAVTGGSIIIIILVVALIKKK